MVRQGSPGLLDPLEVSSDSSLHSVVMKALHSNFNIASETTDEYHLSHKRYH